MRLLCRFFSRKTLLLGLVASLSLSSYIAEAKTALLFGATGAVGNSVLRAILRNNSFFTKIIIVGRRFPPKVTDLLPASRQQLPEVVRVELPDLGNVDQNEELLAMGPADACFIATGSGFPHLYDFRSFHFVEVDMVASMARLCEKLKVQSLTSFSSVDPEEHPTPYTREELESGDDGTPIGWWGLLTTMVNVMGLKEVALTENSGSIPFVRIFQPCNIITEEIRYGWLDWTIFRIHPWIDPIIPTKYHSVDVVLLGMAMVRDAINLISVSFANSDADRNPKRLTYGDFAEISGKEFMEWKEQQMTMKEIEL
ncbi:unnamed protein product [Pseudo-nitzschia multistriata]|uniref:NAD(P)-binding domain-containing protein n=1 Tax=Pseudo-nitzschia multistriata TaxID=183589 RepID=A0A448ZC81_9STRA|nr:unnamed protein product [Pseudo-nitzschia multistriata]